MPNTPRDDLIPNPADRWSYIKSPDFNVAQPETNQGSISGPIDQGWFVNPNYPASNLELAKNARLSITRKEAANPAAGSLAGGPRTYAVTLHVKDIQLGFNLSGSTGQSQQLRQFFARNINLPEMVVTAQAPSSRDYSFVAEFIRFTQKFLTNVYQSPSTAPDNLVSFFLKPYTQRPANNTDPNRVNLNVTYTPPPEVQTATGRKSVVEPSANGNSMGDRGGFNVSCYITDVSRAVQVGQNAYEYQFTVTIVNVDDNSTTRLPFSINSPSGIKDNLMVEGNQWAREQIDLAPKDFFVKKPNISIENKPPTKGKGKGGNPTSNAPKAPPPVVTSALQTTISEIGQTPISILQRFF